MIKKIKKHIPMLPALALKTFWQRRQVNLSFGIGHATRYYYFLRNGIYETAKRLGLENQEVLIPAYNSQSEADALKAIGVNLCYYEVEQNCQVSLDAIKNRLTPQTKALYVIHYFGFAQPMEEIVSFCKEHDLILLEDCALSLYSKNRDKPLGSYGAVGLFCIRKYLPIPNGGSIVSSHLATESFSDLKAPSKLSTIFELVGLLVSNISKSIPGLVPLLKFAKKSLKSVLGKAKTDSGDPNFEVEKTNWGMSRISSFLLNRLDHQDVIDKRRENYFYLKQKITEITENKKSQHLEILNIKEQIGFVPFCLPLIVDDNIKWSEKLLAHGIQAGAWWPTDRDPVPKQGMVTNTWLRKHILELPVHQGLDKADMDYIANIIKQFLSA